MTDAAVAAKACWPWRHRWSQWEPVMRDNIIHPKTKMKVGIIFIQKRTCQICHFTEYNRQRVMAE